MFMFQTIPVPGYTCIRVGDSFMFYVSETFLDCSANPCQVLTLLHQIKIVVQKLFAISESCF